MRVGVIGGGQLGWMLGEASRELNHECVFVDPNPECPASRVGPVLNHEFNDPTYVDKLAAMCDVVTFEFENVDVGILSALAEKIPVYPNLEVLKLSQDRKLEKEALQQSGMETASWLTIDQASDYERVMTQIGFPFIVKTRRFGYDGKGQFVVRSQGEYQKLSSDLPTIDAIAEQMIPFDFEVSIIAARTVSGEVVFYPLTKNHHSGGILRTSIAPLVYSTHDKLSKLARNYCADFMNAHSYVGVMALEFFAVGDRLIANELAPRVHNSGHWTMDCEISSQFENHIRALTRMPLGATLPRHYVAMINVIGKHPARIEALDEFGETRYYDYGKSAREGRKLAHINTKADSYPLLVEKITRITNAIQLPDVEDR